MYPRYLLSAFVFVAAFWLGVFVQSLVNPSDSVEHRVLSSPPAEPLRPPAICSSGDGVELKYYYRGGVGSVGTLVVSNHSFKPIFYYVDANYGNLIDRRIYQTHSDADPYGTETRVLEPGKIATFSDVKYEQSSFTITFNYRHGESEYIRTITAKFWSGSFNSEGCNIDGDYGNYPADAPRSRD